VHEIYDAWDGLGERQSPVAVVNTLPARELPFLLKDYPLEFVNSQIWVHVYSKQLCNRPFEPQDPSSVQALYPDLDPVDSSLWPLYEEYGLLPAVQCGNLTNLHVRCVLMCFYIIACDCKLVLA
jgi:hypothetical protein